MDGYIIVGKNERGVIIYSRPCQTCGKPVRTSLSQIRLGYGRHCSRRCGALGRVRASATERLWAKVDKRDGCWNWTAYCQRGEPSFEGRPAWAVAWEAAAGRPSQDVVPKRTCSNRLCINPEHITLLSRDEVRFWRRVEKRGPDECWEWQGSTRNDSGYGQISVGGSGNSSAHRVSYCLTHGIALRTIAGVFVLHSCDNPPCCNPAHLRLGDALMNAQDRVDRGRSNQCRGVDHGSAKFTDSIVRRIRREHAGGISQGELARRLGVSQATVWRAVHGRTWSHVK